jgi:hypothetical protein
MHSIKNYQQSLNILSRNLNHQASLNLYRLGTFIEHRKGKGER